MKIFNRLFAAVIIFFAVLTAVMNIAMLREKDSAEGLYRVEAKRIIDDIERTGTYELSDYPHITGVYTADDDSLFVSDEHYLIAESGDRLYRIEYRTDDKRNDILYLNITAAIMFLLIMGIMLYIRRQIIVPFGRINNVPDELARGNLAVEIPEEKSRFFGKFTWGVNMLRENIETSRKKELTMQRDKKLLLLSLSHDIKTPLSAIKLNAKALAKGLYKDEDKRRSAAESINSRADEIEHFVSEITRAASEDFMEFEVKQGEEFLSVIMAKLGARYSPQLAVKGTEFNIGEYSDCILSCDPDRLAECLQNLMENAIKYGDGRSIGISFDRMDGCELITVANTGCTLDPKELPQIFSSFHRGSNAEKIQGNGLGLFICKRLMSMMNGDIYADIKDSRFEMTLVVRLA